MCLPSRMTELSTEKLTSGFRPRVRTSLLFDNQFEPERWAFGLNNAQSKQGGLINRKRMTMKTRSQLLTVRIAQTCCLLDELDEWHLKIQLIVGNWSANVEIRSNLLRSMSFVLFFFSISEADISIKNTTFLSTLRDLIEIIFVRSPAFSATGRKHHQSLYSIFWQAFISTRNLKKKKK